MFDALVSMAPTLHSQLFRNIVLASEMAEKDWHVVNLVITQLFAVSNGHFRGQKQTVGLLH